MAPLQRGLADTDPVRLDAITLLDEGSKARRRHDDPIGHLERPSLHRPGNRDPGGLDTNSLEHEIGGPVKPDLYRNTLDAGAGPVGQGRKGKPIEVLELDQVGGVAGDEVGKGGGGDPGPGLESGGSADRTHAVGQGGGGVGYEQDRYFIAAGKEQLAEAGNHAAGPAGHPRRQFCGDENNVHPPIVAGVRPKAREVEPATAAGGVRSAVHVVGPPLPDRSTAAAIDAAVRQAGAGGELTPITPGGIAERSRTQARLAAPRRLPPDVAHLGRSPRAAALSG